MDQQQKKDKILEVKNLRIDFWTNNGTVKAVRGISFSLYRGRTLAIVGESGSGKSVTSRAIMGILAPNKIVQQGEILFDGKDLLRISEEEYTKIRGSKIAMIFQDPMSSLNPIMRVGKQITESMMLKKKATIKESKKGFGYLRKRLETEDSSSKTPIEAILAHKEYSKDSLLNTCESLLKKDDQKLKEADQNLLKVVEEVRASDVFKDDCSHILELKKHFRIINGALGPAKGKLREEKDENVYTFFVTLKYLYSQYVKSLKDEKKKARRVARLNRRAAKGKGKGYDAIKDAAWNSEIDTSHQAEFSRIKDFVDSFIAYLKKLINNYASIDYKTEAQALLVLVEKYAKGSQEKIDKAEFKRRAVDVMREVGIAEPEKRINQYPFQFSGGMRQRIVIAIALSSNPEVLICDEPTTALDVTIQAQILDLINKLKVERNLSVIFITHNLGVVANMADDIAIMYAGKIVEFGTADDIFYEPKHPYTWALLNSMPDLDTKERLDAIPGAPPNMIVPPKGDAFAERNRFAMKIDFEQQPPFFKVSDTHYAATWLLDPRSPKVSMPKNVAERIQRFERLNAEAAAKAKKAKKEE